MHSLDSLMAILSHHFVAILLAKISRNSRNYFDHNHYCLVIKTMHFSVSSIHNQNFFKKTATWLPHSQLWGHYQGASLTHPMLITVLYIQPKGHQEPHSEVGSQSPLRHLVGFELEPSNSDYPIKDIALMQHTFTRPLINTEGKGTF